MASEYRAKCCAEMHSESKINDRLAAAKEIFIRSKQNVLSSSLGDGQTPGKLTERAVGQ